jgi:hypothetical protein
MPVLPGISRRWRAACLCVMLMLPAASGRAFAQNLFEVQVFPDENLARGETDLEFHNVFMPSGTRLPDQTLDPSRHVHVSAEITHGWSDSFETGFFLETSPSSDDRHAAFTGWHVRPKLRLPEWKHVPLHVSLGLEYAFLKQPGDAAFSQAIGITPILERHSGAFEMSVNPGIEIVVKGQGAGEAPAFTPSGKAAMKWGPTVWVSLEYYAETGSIKHFEPLAEQHHLIVPAIDVRTSSGWDLNVGVGRGLTGGSEHWVVKSILAIRLTGRHGPAPADASH